MHDRGKKKKYHMIYVPALLRCSASKFMKHEIWSNHLLQNNPYIMLRRTHPNPQKYLLHCGDDQVHSLG